MALSTYSELKTEIADRIDRDDLDSAIESAILLSETEIYDWLRTLWVQSRAYIVPTSAFVTLPTDYNGMVTIQYTQGGYRYTLDQVSPHMLDQISPSNTSGQPRYYAVHDSRIEIRPAFSSTNTTQLEMTYYFKPVELSDTNTSNELLVNAPHLLFSRAVAEMFDHLMDEPRAQKYMARYEAAKQRLMKNDKIDRWSGVPLRVRVDSQDRM